MNQTTAKVIPRTYGRMGNFLFQAACAMAYAWKHNLEYTLPGTTRDAKNNPIYLQHLVKPLDTTLPTQHLVQEGFTFKELPFEESWRHKNIVLDGYWQSEKFFAGCRDRLLTEFGFEWKLWVGFVSVHVRRGDYLTLKKQHPPVPLEWIRNAMERFPGYHFVFFSDDVPWCRAIFGSRKDCTISRGEDPVKDLVDMSHCEHHICSASTFSWWGAWLNRNPDKKVVIPSRWFMPGRPEDTRDIVPLSWIRL